MAQNLHSGILSTDPLKTALEAIIYFTTYKYFTVSNYGVYMSYPIRMKVIAYEGNSTRYAKFNKFINTSVELISVI